MLFGLLIVAGIGIVGLFSGMMQQETYGSKLEQYIVNHNPRDIADVERLASEYDRKTKEGYL